jgi:diguanylate cyclase (GGDEF)-like protein/PAS domain S-box-containing protein
MQAPTIRVLLNEDVVDDAELELRELRRAGLRVAHRLVDTEKAFTEALRGFVPDVILSDFSMPRFDGMMALAIARELSPDTPFIFVSGTVGEEYAIRALKSGATDYVLKNNLMRLPAAVERAAAEANERRERRRTEAELEVAQARLTSIFNSLPDVLWSVDPYSDRIIYVSPAVKEVFGRPPEECLTQQELWPGVVHPEDRDKALAAWNDVRRGAPFDIEYRTIRPDGTVRWINDRARQIRGENGAVLRIDGVARDITDRVEHRERIAYLARYDALTDLPNRTLFHERLTQAVETARRSNGALALAVIDLERFKAINDTLGMHTGDKVLRAAAHRLHELAGDVHRVARVGGNLFALIVHGISGAEEVARRLEAAQLQLFGTAFTVDGHEIRLTGKIGVAVYPEDGADADALFRNAEASLKRAKETGERYLFYAPEINARVAEQVELEHRLRKAVEHGELFLHFQPKLELATRRIVGVEALMRWAGPDGAPVSPAKFVPVLEQTGLILEAGRQAIATASTTYRTWHALGLPMATPRIAVNVSALQLRRKSFVADVCAALREAGDGGGVDLEITESLLMADVDESIRKLRALREMGMHISLDDFGTGYSSLAYLSKLPLDDLKIDRVFVRGMTEKAEDTSIVSTIISLAQGLNLKVVAEGVETEEQAQLLRLLRCDQVQGFLFSPPVAADKIQVLLRA